MRRLLYYSLLCLLWISVDSCKDDEVAAPPKPSFSVDKTSGLYNATEFTFTIDQVEGNSISLLPYGVDNPSFGGVNVPLSSFTNGKASVKFTYAKIGTYNAVVVVNNHSTDGNSIKNEYSDAKAITITSDQTKLSDFTIENATKSEFKNKVSTNIDTFLVTMPYGFGGKATDITKLKGKFSNSDFSTVFIGSAAQTSGTTENNYSAPVTYTVKSQDGAKSTDYLVIVSVTPIETANTFKSASGIITGKASKDKVLPASIDNTTREIVIYNKLGTVAADFDSIAFDYSLTGSFAYVKYAGKKLKAKTQLDLSSSKQVEVTAQDSSKATYTVYAKAAPKLSLSLLSFDPDVIGTTTDFTVALNVLTGSEPALAAIPLTAVVDPAGASMKITELSTVTDALPNGVPKAFTSGDVVNLTKGAKIELTVTDGGVTYKVVYTVNVTVLK